MTKDELNREWADLEGWTVEHSHSDELELFRWMKDGKNLNDTVFAPRSNCGEALPNFTEPNRFFAEVVPRMESLGLYPNVRKMKSQDTWTFGWFRESLSDSGKAHGPTVGEAGLEAAIKARKGLGL